MFRGMGESDIRLFDDTCKITVLEMDIAKS
jgi:hypothetical protein